MSYFVPEWAPNIHPLLVHFPIALLFVAAFFDFLFLIFDQKWLINCTVSLYVLGAIAALVTYLTGQQAAGQVDVPLEAELALSNHADWAFYTLWFFGIYAILRIISWWKSLETLKTGKILQFVIGLAGLYLLYQTGDHGAQLVFKYGLGV